MAIDEKLNEKLERYLANQMNEQEHGQFEQLLHENEELAAQLKMHQAFQEIFSDQQDQMRQLIKEVVQEKNEATPVVKMKPFKKYYYLIAASVTLLILGFSFLYLNDQAQPDQLYDDNFRAFDNVLNIRGADQESTALQEALVYYEQENYKYALSKFDQLADTISQYKDFVLLYMGISHACTSDLDQAVRYLEKSLSISKPPLTTTVQWYLALVHLKKLNIEKSKVYLDEIIKDTNSSYYAQAKKLRKDLD